MTKTISSMVLVALFALVAVVTAAANPATKPGPKGTTKRCYKIECDGGSICFYFVTGQNQEIGVPGVASVTMVPCIGGAHGITNPIPTTAIFAVTSSTGGIGWINCDAIVDGVNNVSYVTEYYESTEFTNLSAWQAAH